MNGENIVIEDMDATQPMLLTSTPSRMNTGTPVRRISSLSSLTNISPIDIDLTQSSPEERASPEEKRGRFRPSPDPNRSSSLSRLWPTDVSDQNSSGVADRSSENVDLGISNDLKDPDSLPLLQEEPLRISDRAAQIIAFDIDSLGEKICVKVPQICPGKTAAYLVDLSKLAHPDDISRDVYGSWGRYSCDNYYYAIDNQSKSVRKLNCGKLKKMEEGAKVDMKIRRRFCKHPKTNGQFRKSIYIAFFGENVVPKWAIVSYEWLCPPFDFLNRAHGNSKDQTKPFQPTAKSVIDRMREKARYLTPQQNVHSMTEEVGTMHNSSPAFVPRGKKQARDIAYTIPDSKKGKGGSSVRTDFDHVARMVFEPNSFVLAFKPGGSLGLVRALLGSKQNVHLFRKAVLEGGCIIFVDMTYNPCEKGYLTIISVRHPLLIDAETGRNVLRPVAFYLSTERKTEDYNCMAEEIKLILRGGASQQTHSTVVVRTTPGTPGACFIKVISLIVSAPGQLMAAAQAQTRSAPPKLSNGSKLKPTTAQRAKLFERKEIVCTEPWHNMNKFKLMFTDDFFNTQSMARLCWSCKKHIEKAASPDDMVVVHMERFCIPPPESKWSAHMQNRITHARYSCVIGKYPYFTPDLLEATVQVKEKLTPKHERYLADQLGIDFLNH